MALIGASKWDPTGESMWSIVTRLSQRNYLNWVETRRLFGSKDLRSFVNTETQDPDNASNFLLPGICVSTGWSLGALQSSFSNWYYPPWLDEKERANIRKSSTYLRACPKCLANGSHLLLHQLLDWVRCPIHDEPLSTRCAKCRNLLGRFSITKELEQTVGHCQHCQKLLLNGKSKCPGQQARRLRVIKEYADWLQELRSSFDPTAGRYRWLGHRATMRNLVHLHQLVPGPTWVSHCMANAARVRAAKWTWTGAAPDEGRTARSYRIPKDPIRLRYDFHCRPTKLPAVADDFSRYLANGVQQHHGRLVAEFDLSCRKSGMQEWNSTECTPLYGEDVDAWSTAYWMWRRSLDEAFPLGLRWTRSLTRDPMEMSWLWESWVNSVGTLIWAPFKTLKRPFNAAYVRWLTKLWLRRECEDHFALFVGLACRMVGDRWMNTNWLVGEVAEVGDPAFWVREIDANGNASVHALTTIAPIQEFLDLKQRGFTGTDLNYFQSFERLRPLLDLLGTHPQNSHWWETHWRKTQRRQRERRNSLLSVRKANAYELHDQVSVALGESRTPSENTSATDGGVTSR